MLGSFMDELQITPAKFERACLEGRQQQRQGEGRAFHQRLFQQIWAANDIRIFIRMMTQRNVELQLQALDLIERNNSREEATTGGAAAAVGGAERPAHPAAVTEGTEKASDLIEFNEQGGDDALIETNAEQEEELLESLPNDEELAGGGGGGGEEKDSEGAAGASASTNQEKSISDKFERLNLFFEKERVDEGEVKQRQDYLRAQRDKILEIKKRTRARQLNETLGPNKQRPSSARAAQKILLGQKPDKFVEPLESSLQLRRVLAKRLRDEVVDGKARGE